LTNQWAAAPLMTIDPHIRYIARVETELGTMVMRLFADKAPRTVNNFVFLAREGYYDGTIFHRVIKEFMAQGGDPTGTGTGGPGYRFNDEFHSDLVHDRPGIVSMANAGPNTNGSQFFITHAATPWLDRKHSVFGELTEGLDILNSIPARDPSRPGSPGIKIIRLTIEETAT
jgi:cyclophilin family peptidyl-prolyl cis-trans isomerase